MTVATSRRVELALIVAIVWLARQASAQSRETLETKVTATGDQIVLHWGKKHPWDAELMARGAFLLGEYRANDGAVYLDCLELKDGNEGSRPGAMRGYGCQGLAGTPSSNREDRTIRFHLPETVTRTPTGSICLYFRLPNQRVLPIRKAENGRETSRFQYVDWEAQAKSRVKAYEGSVQTRTLRHNVEVLTRSVAAQDSLNRRRGWTSASACQGIQAPDLNQELGERPLAEPADREETARQVCIMRVWNVDSILAAKPLEFRIGVGYVQPPTVLDRLVALFKGTKVGSEIDLSGRATQAEQFRQDWGRLASRVREYKAALQRQGYHLPHFGDFSDWISLQSITGAIGSLIGDSLRTRGGIRPDHVTGYVGGTLESYSRCVTDGQAQLTTAYTAIMEKRRRSPELTQAVRQELIQACNQGVTKLAALRDTLTAMQGRLAQSEKTLADASGGAGSLPDKERELNGETCTP